MKKLSLKRVIMTVLSAAMVFSAIPAVYAEETAAADYTVIYSAQYTGKDSKDYKLSNSVCDANNLITDKNSQYVAIRPQKNGENVAFETGKTYVLSLKMKKDAGVDKNFCFYGFCKDNHSDNPPFTGYDRAIRLNEEWQTYSWTISGGTYSAAPWLRFQAQSSVKIQLSDIKITEWNITKIPDLTATAAGFNTSDAIRIRYSYDMSADAEAAENYTIDGKAPKSVSYDAETRTATLVPAEPITTASVSVTMKNLRDVTGRTLNTVKQAEDNKNRCVIVYKTITANILDNPETEDYKVICFGQYEGKNTANYALEQGGNCSDDSLAIGSGYVSLKPWENGKDIALEKSKSYCISLKMKKDSTAGEDTRFYALCTPNNPNGDFGKTTNLRLADEWQTYSWVVSGYTVVPWLRFQGTNGEEFNIKDIKVTELKNTRELTAEAEPLSTDDAIRIRYSYDMSADAAAAENYTIDGKAPKTVSYDAETRTATLVPAEPISTTSVSVTMKNLSDVTGRTLNTAELAQGKTNRYVIAYKTVTASYPKDTLGASKPVVSNGTATMKGLYNTTSQEQKAMLIVAAFDDAQGCLVKAAVKNITIESGAVLRNQSVSLDAVPAGCSVKAFIWDASTLVAIEE